MGKKEPKDYQKKVHVQAIPIPGLNAKEYEDPRDAKYLETLKLTKGFDRAVKLFFEYGLERILMIQYTGSNVQVTKDNMPYVYNCLEEACKILDVPKLPKMYIQQTNEINAMTIGAKDPIIVLNKGCIHRLNHEELMFVIGHEVGHIKSEHCMYHSIGSCLGAIGSAIGAVTLGLGEAVSFALQIAYNDWNRKSEFTADRAGFLTCQSIDATISALAKIAGLPLEYYKSFNKEHFLEQARMFQELDESKYNKVMKMISLMGQDHPWTVMRAHELQGWLDSGEYEKIILRSNSNVESAQENAAREVQKTQQTMDQANEAFGRAIMEESNTSDQVDKLQADVDYYAAEKARLIAERTDPRGVQQAEVSLREATRKLEQAKRAQTLAKNEYAKCEKQVETAQAAYEDAVKRLEAAEEAVRLWKESQEQMESVKNHIQENAFKTVDADDGIDEEED